MLVFSIQKAFKPWFQAQYTYIFYVVCVESGTSISHVAPHRYIH